MLQHRQPHGDSKRQEFSQSGDHHSPIRQPVHVRNALTSGRTASWRAPLTEMCAYWTNIGTLWTVNPKKPFLFPYRLYWSPVYGWELENILYFIWNIKVTWTFSMVIQWNTMENLTHGQSFWFLWLKWRSSWIFYGGNYDLKNIR